MKHEWIEETPEALKKIIPGAGRHIDRKVAREMLRALSKDDEHGCWIFHKEPNASGYPYMDGYGPSHRVSFWAYNCPKGKIPGPFMNIKHSCDDPQCVNPEHLVAVDGTDRRWRKKVASPYRKGSDGSY